jgi:hypothetical protein
VRDHWKTARLELSVETAAPRGEGCDLLGVNKDVDFLLDQVFRLVGEGAILWGTRLRCQVGREERQLSELRLGKPSFGAGGMVEEHGFAVEEALRGLLLVLRDGCVVGDIERTADCLEAHFDGCVGLGDDDVVFLVPGVNKTSATTTTTGGREADLTWGIVGQSRALSYRC